MGTFLNYASNPNHLFMGPPLQEALQDARRGALQRLRDWDPDALLAAAETDVVDELLNQATFDVPDVHRDRAHLAERPEEISQPFQSLNGGTVKQTITRYTLMVPISGPAVFFHMTATTFSPGNPISARINPSRPELLLHCDGMTEPAGIKAYFDQELDKIQERLPWTQADVEAHNKTMQAEIRGQVVARRAKLLADRKIQASIGFPIQQRDAADTYSLPLTRRTIQPRQPTNSTSTNPYTPEPALADADYEAALAVLHRTRNALERSPSMTEKLDEEEIRDLLLVMLNDHFEGRAGGEVFNCRGKTDILIRERDRNVFIGECKVHDPRNKQSVERVVTGALDQLLDYLAWRDTKAALLLFVRDADLSTVMDKAITAHRLHPQYKRDGQVTNQDRHDVVIHANGDPSREIHLAFLPFHVGSRQRQPAE